MRRITLNFTLALTLGLGIVLTTTLVAAQYRSYQPRPQNVIKVSHLGTHDVAITCLNGADPTGRKIQDVLVISCARAGDDRPDAPQR